MTRFIRSSHHVRKVPVRDRFLDARLRHIVFAYPGIRIRIRLENMENRPHGVLANDMLGVVFDNLFSNSVKSGGKDTEITVRTETMVQDLLQISVSDTGPGIADAMKPLVFDRFMQDRRKRSSYGLGLHIIKMLVESCGGTVWADDRIPGEPRKGAIVKFTLRPA